MKLYNIIFALLTLTLPLYADCPAAFSEGNLAYQHGDYPQAIRSYQQCLDANVRSADVYYNLGNAYFRADTLGKAILYYESALRLDPGNSDIQHNLKFAEARKVDKVQGDQEENPVLQALFSLHHALSLDTQLMVLLGLGWLCAILLLLLVLWRQERFRNVAYGLLAIIALLGSMGALSAGYKAWQLETVRVGVVTARSADVYSGPGQQYQVLNELHEGTRFEVREVQNGWVSLRVDDRVGGFVPSSQVGLVQ
jgi:tetratricopeptide (TPR) repeat protein